MSKKLLIGMVLALSSLAQAEATFKAQYTCKFTEPFLTVVYNESANTLTVDDMGEQILKVSRASIKIDQSNNLVVVDSRSKELLKVEKSEGSDGMSDIVYPLTGIYEGHIGGCHLTLTK